MKCAVLCNGPSRAAYQPSDEYHWVVGCNVPWTDVDATVVVDNAVVELWATNRALIAVPVFFSKSSWTRACEIDKAFFSTYYIEDVVVDPQHHSAGHNAVEIAIKRGYVDIDVYGCDAYFNGNVDSYTRQFIDISSPNYELRARTKMINWKVRWDQLVANNANVNIKFIRG